MSIPCKMRPVGLQSLPLGYTRLEYLEAAGNAIRNLHSYIMLPVDINLQTDSFAFETEHELVQSNENQAEGSNIHRPMLFYGMRTNDIAYYGFDYAGQTVADGTAVTPGYNVFRAEYDKGTARFLRNNFLEAQIQKDIPQSNLIFRLLGVFGTTGLPITEETLTGNAYPFNGRKKYFKVWVNDELKRHLIPSLSPAGIPCMFDLVSKTPFYNQGTGAFIVGLTIAQALSLANLPTTADGTLTVSLPWEAEWDARVQNALDRAAAKGWIITVQYRDPEVATTNIPIGFLESTGTQCIETRISVDSTYGASVKWEAIQRLSYSNVLSTRNTKMDGNTIINRGAFVVPYWNINGFLASFMDNGQNLYRLQTSLMLNLRYISTLNFLNDRQIKLNNDIIGVIPEDIESYTCANPVLFGSSRDGILFEGARLIGRIYSAKISQGTAVKMDFAPSIDPSGTPCMRDSVSRQNFYNSGTGAFIAGFDTAEQARKLAYLPDVTAETDETKKSLTVSIPLEVVLDPGVQSALDVAAARGWTIIVQHRESEITTTNLEADFLESTGTQAIDTLIPADECSYFAFTGHTFEGNLEQECFIGAGTGVTRLQVFTHTQNFTIRNAEATNTVYLPSFEKTSVEYHVSSGEYSFNDTSGILTRVGTVSSKNMALFARREDTGAFGWFLRGSIYSAGLRSSYVERTLIPTIDSTGTPCMQDTISGQNFYNQGTGSFTVGFDTTEKAAISLSKLPVTTNGTLTVSLPAEAEDTATLVPAAIDIAKSRGWTIITQYRED